MATSEKSPDKDLLMYEDKETAFSSTATNALEVDSCGFLTALPRFGGCSGADGVLLPADEEEVELLLEDTAHKRCGRPVARVGGSIVVVHSDSPALVAGNVEATSLSSSATACRAVIALPKKMDNLRGTFFIYKLQARVVA